MMNMTEMNLILYICIEIDRGDTSSQTIYKVRGEVRESLELEIDLEYMKFKMMTNKFQEFEEEEM